MTLDPTGPRVVAIGGGRGLSSSLHSLRQYASEITAIVSVADDGGSTGELRKLTDVPAMGDLRKSLVALGHDDGLLAASMEYRFASGPMKDHAMGNLLITAMTEVGGDIVAVLDELGGLLHSEGRVLPATTLPVTLRGLAGGREVLGQVRVSQTSGLDGVSLVPADPPALPEAVEALTVADQVVIGPGSLYTSVLAALAVPQLLEAVLASPAQTVYVCNLRPQRGETSGYTLGDYAGALVRHGLETDCILYDSKALEPDPQVPCAVAAELARDGVTHDPKLLAAALKDLAEKR
ncbi:MAG: Gluconeogenesis factor [Acidimicrobiales bacterium]|nr:MAG: uridine diphosphate-N-acetylglucosamine-binding protein YvcK [Actinomycetota bacterium]MBV6509498.1 Gluconeogenesis factor [Acidimicrobiales bacterium]RIK06631.1 MAG: hypothetical protein DCC48_06910 [Acidobacteriota bacterium]